MSISPDSDIHQLPDSIKKKKATTESYYSCRYLEGGLSFVYNEIKACSIRHHGRGAPTLMTYKGGDLDFAQLNQKKAEIREENQQGGYKDCVGCPYLTKQKWSQEEKNKITWIGITHYIVCNIECNFCWLQWAEWSPRKKDKHPSAQLYNISELIKQLIEKKQISKEAVIDWGGGGEPTLMKEFNELFTLFGEHGITQWIHTNAVSLPKSVRQQQSDLSKVSILCSVDAGSNLAYFLIKKRNAFEDVCRNLKTYEKQGAKVVLKYIFTEENCDRINVEGFIDLASTFKNPTVIADIDYRFPAPSKNIMVGLRMMYRCAQNHSQIVFKYGSTGARSALEYKIHQRIGMSDSDIAKMEKENISISRKREHFIPYHKGKTL